MAGRSILFICRHSPYGSHLARSGLDAALAAAAFEQTVTLLFLGDGVLQLNGAQEGRAIGHRDLGRLLASLPLYDIESVYAEAVAMQRHGIDETSVPLPVKLLDHEQIQGLLSQSDHLLGF